MLIKLVMALVAMLLVTPPGTAAGRGIEPDDPNNPAFSLTLPKDAGAHADAKTEWWYLTGWLDDAGTPVGFQVTFFRSSLGTDPDNPSGFNSHDAIFAHVALSDPRIGHVLFAQQSMRAVFGLAGASSSEMNVYLKDWSLRASGNAGQMQTRIVAANFAIALNIVPLQPLLLEGPQGVSRKGPVKASSSDAVSAYYSLPHLRVQGSITIGGRMRPVQGSAWFDHEWSNQYLESDAQGWDWIGANLNDGSALMAFRMRKTDGSVLYSAATRRTATGVVQYLGPDAVRFEPISAWKSPHSGVRYPLAQELQVGAERFRTTPLIDDQEIDGRNSTGTLYWEGAVRLMDDHNPALELGQGYLELTGYGDRLRLQ